MSYRLFALVATVMLVIALADLPYGYYTALRIIVCGVAAYGVQVARRANTEGWMVALGLIAIVFNPIIPIYLDRGVWAIVDLIGAVVLLTSALTLPGKAVEAQNSHDSS